jgi:hypothetical protein
VELPAREAAWDDFAELFHRGAEASVRFAGGTGGPRPVIAALAALALAPKEART